VTPLGGDCWVSAQNTEVKIGSYREFTQFF